MKPDNLSSDPPEPAPHDRIEQLEEQVKELKTLVEVLLNRPDAKGENADKPRELPEPTTTRTRVTDSLRASVKRALGGEQGESIESRIGGIWLSRIASLVAMTALALGGAVALNTEELLPVAKVLIGYGLATAAITYGLLRRGDQNFFAQSMLGAGLATLYFTTYAGFFIESTQVFSSRTLAVPVLGGVLVAIGAVAHRRRSQTAAGIALFLIYYTVVLSLTSDGVGQNVFYALLTCSVVSIMALVFHLTHRWLFFTWAALIASQLTYIFFFIAKPPELDISEQAYFWLSNGFLALTWVVFSIACITDARKTGEFRKTVAPMAGVNSFVFLVLSWLAIRAQYPEYEWAFRLSFAVMLAIFALYAHAAGPRRNYLYQIFLAKTVVMLTLALQARLSHEWLLVAMALECLALAFSYKRAGLVIFKLMGLSLLAITFVGCIVSIRMPGEVIIFDYTIPAKWFACVGAPLIFAIVAWFYDHFIPRLRPEDREVKGQWFLADTIWDTSSPTTALLYSAAGALILMAITILELGDVPALPYILAGEGVLMALLGLLLRTSQVEVASVLLLVAGHVTYHVFLFTGKAGFETQPFYVQFTLLVATLTFFGGYLWERYLRRIEGGAPWEHNALASAPYVAATVMMATLMQRELTPVFVPLGQHALGVALLVIGAVTLLVGMRVAGVLSIIFGTLSFYHRLYTFEDHFAEQPEFFVSFALFLAAYVTAERVVAMSNAGALPQTATEGTLRTVFVSLAALLGLLGLNAWAPPEILSLYWLGLALISMTLGTVFWESRYRWAALVIYFFALGRAYLYDLTNLEPLPKFLSFAAMCVPLLVISWGYSLYRTRTLRRLHEEQDDAQASHE